MNNNINNTTTRQVARDYLVQNNVSEQLKETKDKDREKKDSKITGSGSEKNKRKNSIESGDFDDPEELFVSDKSGDKDETVTDDEKELTVLFYLRGDCNLGDQMAKAMVDLESLGSTDDINMVAQFNRKNYDGEKIDPEFAVDGDWEANRRYYITKNENPDFEELTVDKLLDLAAEHPGNPYFCKEIAQKYRLMGDKDKMEEYLSKENEVFARLSVQEKQKFSEEHSAAIDKEFGRYMNFSSNLFGFERLGVTEITSEILEEFPNVQNNEYQEDLQNFVEWGMEKFPAKNHVLVISGHGGATGGAVKMSPAEMREALTDGVKNGNEKTGRDDSIDAIVFNTCLMGNLEAATELKDNTRVFIGSEAVSNGSTGLQWDTVLSKVQENIDETGHFDVIQFGNDYVEHFKIDENDRLGKGYNKGYDTVSATDTQKLPDLLKSFNKFLETCEKEGVDDNQLFKAAAKAQDFEMHNNNNLYQNYKHLVDFGSFINKLQKAEDSPEPVKEAAGEVLKKLGETVINHHQNTGDRNYHYKGINETSGLTLWAPDNSVYWDSYAVYTDKGYSDNVPEFVESSLWDDRVRQAARNIPQEIRGEVFMQRRLMDFVQRNGTENLPDGTPEELAAEIRKDPEKFYEKVEKMMEKTSFYNTEDE
jgi:hypothetical protein